MCIQANIPFFRLVFVCHNCGFLKYGLCLVAVANNFIIIIR